ncbi:MAG: hypothetical protein AB1513_06885 [Pseudomonadota bacterium]
MMRKACLIMLLALAAPSGAQELGRLFFTPAQRAALDSARQQNVRIDLTPAEEQETADAAPAGTITFNGIVRRSDGHASVWVNNKRIDDRDSGNIRILRRDGTDSISIQAPNSDSRVNLKVGQNYDTATGQVQENYASRPAPAPKPAAAPQPPSAPKTTKPAPAEQPAEANGDQ